MKTDTNLTEQLTEGGISVPRQPALILTTAVYVLMVIVSIFIFFLIRNYGETLHAPPAVEAEPLARATAGRADILRHVLIALAAVIIVGQLLSKVFAYVSQPPVIGEVVAGILLGPSLIGTGVSAFILPPDAAPFLGVVAQLGVILYMFIVGLDLNAGLVKQRAHSTVATSHASILLPFLLGSLLALFFYPRLSSSDVSFTSFALFLGVAMSITAFPVLARILTDHDLTRTQLGVVALSCAAADDVTAWCLLAFIVGYAEAQVGASILIIVWTLIYISFMLFVARPLLRKLARRREHEDIPRASVALVFVALLLSAITTELIGIHAVFGAFLLGAVIPHDSAVARTFSRQLEPVVAFLLLPAFFAFVGMRTRIDLLSGMDQWVICGGIILVATLGKLGGTFVAARLTGLTTRDATALGILMNTRGLMELIVLNVGLDLKVISPTLFAMMVLMALVTTMMTSPVLRILMKKT